MKKVMRSQADSRYLEGRKALSQKLGPQEIFSIADHWPLYAGTQNIARYFSIYEALKNTPSTPGHVAEFGTWNGSTTMFMSKMMTHYWPNIYRRFLCFDTFEGLPQGSAQDGVHNALGGGYTGNLERFQDLITLYDLEHVIEIHKGRIEQTLPKALKDESLQFSFIFCDADLYEPTKAALDLCHDRLVPGGCFVFDEWARPEWPGETKAVYEFLSAHPKDYQELTLPASRQPSLMLRKIAR